MTRSHIFDGKTMSKETAAYQLCDLRDPMLKEMVEDDEELRETCNVRHYAARPTPRPHLPLRQRHLRPVLHFKIRERKKEKKY